MAYEAVYAHASLRFSHAQTGRRCTPGRLYISALLYTLVFCVFPLISRRRDVAVLLA